jgi:hypothetical protein
MGRLGWTLLFGSLLLVAIALLSLIGLRLWRSIKALSHDLARASDALAEFGSARDRPSPL